MAQKIQTLFIDDIDGSEAVGTVRFGLDGTAYEIDLNAKHDEALHKALAQYVEAARRTHTAPRADRRRNRRSPQAAAGGAPSEEVRAWARQRGYKINERGRIPAAINAEYAASRNGVGLAPSAVTAEPAPEKDAAVPAAESAPIAAEAAAAPAKRSTTTRKAKGTAAAEPKAAAAARGSKAKAESGATT